MQDRYAGDVGDFGKFALLRALSPQRRVGICWYRTDGIERHSNDGGHLAYLEQPSRFRHLDPELFDALNGFVSAFRLGHRSRSLESLEALALVPPGTCFHRDVCPRSRSARSDWMRQMIASMTQADLVFLDPDNGIEGNTLGPKSASLAELLALRRAGRALLLYHHQTRLAGGARSEAALISRRIFDAGFSSVQAVRLRPCSSRFYFLIEGDLELVQRLSRFADRWRGEAELIDIPS